MEPWDIAHPQYEDGLMGTYLISEFAEANHEKFDDLAILNGY